MKTKIKRHSRSVISVILAISMLISCMMVGLIATDAAKMQSESVGWNSSTDRFHYQVNNSGNWSDASFNSSGKTTFTIASDDTTLEFELNFNGTIYKYDVSQQGFTASDIQKSSGTQRRAMTKGSSTYKITGVHKGTYTVQLDGTPSNGEQLFTISGEGSTETPCTTNQKYVVVGSSGFAGVEWNNTSTTNTMTYDSSIGMYKKEFTNIAASTTGYLFRITTSGNWDTNRGYSKYNGKTDTANLATIENPSDKDNIRIKLSQKANVTVTYHDGLSKGINLIITPAVSTVTAGTATGGTITVNGGASVTNVPYGGQVTLKATANANYHFSKWTTDTKLSFDSLTSADTTALVYGTTTVNATFEPNSFSITKASGNYTMTAPSTAQYTKEVTISATPADGYTVESVWYSTDGGTTKTTAENGKFTMPAGNVTVGAVVHAKTAHTIEYGVVNGQSDWGYVSVGEQHDSNTTIKRTIASGSSVYEDVSVNFGARPAEGYKFVGWFNNENGTDTAISTEQNYNKTGPSGKYYAKFAAAPATVTPDPYLASDKVTLFIASTNKDVYIYTWDGGDVGTSWPGSKSTNNNDYVTIGGQQYMKVQTAKTSFKLQLNLGNDSNKSNDFSFSGSKGSGYYLTYNGHKQNVTQSNYTSQATTTPDPDAATKTYYPIVLNVEHGEYGNTYTDTFAEKSKPFTVNHTPDADHKAALAQTGYTKGTAGTNSTAYTMPADYNASNNVTVSYEELAYYPVTFSAGPNGSIKATTGSADGTEIKSGTMVKEGTKVYFKATGNDNYVVNSWSGNTTTTSSGALNSNTQTKYLTVDGAKNVSVYFAYKNDGTVTSKSIYIAIGNRDITGNNEFWHPDNWSTTRNKVYVKDGHAYWYIDNPGTTKAYYFSLASEAWNNTSQYDAGRKLYHWDDSNLKVNNDFNQYLEAKTGDWGVTKDITKAQDELWYDDKGKSHKYYYGYVYAKSADVKRIIIDLGELSSDGKSVSGNYRVIPVYDTDATNVDIYAKDGTYRGDNWYDFFPKIADTTITDASNIQRHENMSTAAATRGTTITVTTTIDNDNKSKYYVKGFSFNGTTPQLFGYQADGVYTQTYTIPENFAYDYLEITPIYYRKDAAAVEFYIENYDEALQATGWGNTLSVYPYYFVSGKDDLNASDNAFGGYPGQPVIYYGGRRFIQIPTTYTMERAERKSDKNTNYPTEGDTAIIKGITLSNDYWDIVHREYVHAVDQHLQTYDYDDFYKIYKETSDGQEVNKATYTQRGKTADQITFAFKYRDQYDNFGTNRQTEKNGDTKIPSTITKSAYTNGWEPLLDYHDRPIDLFGKILTEEEQKKTPLLAVSNGYEYTHAGYYATTWTIYYKNGSSYSKIGTITPSALEISSKTRLGNRTLYPDSAGRGQGYPPMKQLGDYSSTYNTLKTTYANTPVEITYEKVLSNYDGDYYTSWGEKSNRSDGRWYYSYYNDDVHANIRIEYKNDESETEWTVDPFKGETNQGTVTGGKAYFTNEGKAYKGKTETGTILSNPNSFYEFVATPASGYVFAGWWFERDGIVTNVNEDLTKLDGKSQMTSNATFVARYIKAPTGTLTINHTLADGSVGKGKTYVSVKAINKTTNQETQLATDVENQYAINADYVGYKKDYRFEITLKTVKESDYDVFNRFSAAADYSADFFSTANQQTVGDTTTTSFTVDVDDLFVINNHGFPEQTKDTLTYYSHLNQLNIHYKLIYSYDSMVGGNNFYGLQSYKVEGIFTREEFTKYLTWDSALVTDDPVQETGWYRFNPKADEFMAIKSPHEANIRRDLKWNFTGGNLGTVSYFKKNTANGWNGEITVSKTATNDPIVTKRLQFIFPYRMKNTDNGTVAEKTNDKVIELKETEARTVGDYSVYLTKKDAQFAEPYSLSGGIYVTAEPTIYDANDTSKEKHFQYWSVLAVPSEIEGKEQESDKESDYVLKEVARCYNLGFNFSVYQDYIVKPVYAEAATTKEHKDAATISFAENARNQWNDDKGSAKWAYGDRIFSDFMVGFDRQDKTMLNTVTDNSVTVGLITERLDTIDAANADTKDAGTWKVQSEKFYEDLYADRDADKSEIKAYIRGREADASNNKPAYSGITKSNDEIVLADSGNYENSFIKMSALDNKNRIEFTKVVPNISQKDKTNTGRKDYVYRAYSYMIDWNDTGTIKSIVISKPVYYTIYDIAMIENGKGISTYTVAN